MSRRLSHILSLLMRHLALLGSPVAVVVVLNGPLAMAARPSAGGYAVAAVQAGLAQAPRQWQGRTVLVQGRLVGCPYHQPGPCASWQPVLADPWMASTPEPTGLPTRLQWRHLSRLQALIRQVGFLGALVPAPQVLHWGAVATYRVHLQAMPDLQCGTGVCYGALLLDAAPGAQ